MERELFFIQSLQNAGIELFHSKQADYRTRQAVFEIGGKNKTRNQLKELEEPSYLVKDDIFMQLEERYRFFFLGFFIRLCNQDQYFKSLF